jgi:hypothetical protein
MPSSGIWLRVGLVRTDVSEESVASILRVETPTPHSIPRTHSSLILYNSVALVREITLTTERPPLVSEVSANFCGKRDIAWSARRIPTAVISVLQAACSYIVSVFSKCGYVC